MCWKGGYPTTPMLETPARNASAKSGFLSLFHIKFKKFKKVLDYLPQYGYN